MSKNIYSELLFCLAVVSDSLWSHGLQHSRLPCPSPPPGLMSIESVMPSNHLILCHPLLLLPSIFPSFRVFSNESVLGIKWPKYWGFSFSISPANEYSGVIILKLTHPFNSHTHTDLPFPWWQKGSHLPDPFWGDSNNYFVLRNH